MRKLFSVIITLLLSLNVTAQDFSDLWEGYFSYFNINAISQGETSIYAAAENAIFSFNTLTNEIETITTINGLSGENISTIYYSENFQILVIGYENGLIEIYSENDKSILSVVDILEKETISPALKRINHINENEGFIYISSDFGISVYDLDLLQFGDSYFIGDNGAQIQINQTEIFNGMIYAACGSNAGIRRAPLSNPNLIDFEQWTSIASGNYTAIESTVDNLYALELNGVLNEVNNGALTPVFNYPQLPSDLRFNNDNLLVTTPSTTFVYNSTFNLQGTINTTETIQAAFNQSTIVNDDIYIATTGFGVLKTRIGNIEEPLEIRPEGPLSNRGFKIQAGDNELWMTYGEYSVTYNPSPLNLRGISHLVDGVWQNTPADSILGAFDLCDIAINPFNPSQVFIGSFHSGMLELNDGTPTILYDESNSGLESVDIPTNQSTRVSGLKFDRNGLLWLLCSLAQRPLKSYDPATGNWQSYDFTELIQDPINDENGFGDLDLNSGQNFWVASNENGLIGYDINSGGINNVALEEQNMPSDDCRSVALDNNNQLWIGTQRGLRVLFNTSSFVTEPNPSVSTIVILDDGIGTELLSNQFITDIKVDGSNNKWVGTLDSGIFYFSPDGQETIFQFTTSNSPLPSNAISDISIDPVSGRVYISTSRGLVSFSSGGTAPEENLEDAYVYPNPVRPEYDILGFDDLNNINNGIKILGLTENVNVKITDIEGNLVAEAQSRINQRSSRTRYNFAIDGGTGIWNGKNLAGNIVASGVYLIMISDLDSFESKILKVMIVR
ncbi:MAG: ABC transporter substrate-binding protein [Bacteroidota bacterium]